MENKIFTINFYKIFLWEYFGFSISLLKFLVLLPFLHNCYVFRADHTKLVVAPIPRGNAYLSMFLLVFFFLSSTQLFFVYPKSFTLVLLYKTFILSYIYFVS